MPTLKKGRGGRRNRDGTGGATHPTRKRVPRPPVPPDAGQYLNRELNVLTFFRRVLEEAQDERNPLLERSVSVIVGSNLAEFFMVRVAGLKQQMEAGVMGCPAMG
jgi:polyphosphate kinase